MFLLIPCSFVATVHLKLEVVIPIAIIKQALFRVKLTSCVFLKNVSGDSAFLLAVDKSNRVAIRILSTMPSVLQVGDTDGRTPFHR